MAEQLKLSRKLSCLPLALPKVYHKFIVLNFCLQDKALKEGHSTFTMRRIFDSAKEEFQQLEKLRQVIFKFAFITVSSSTPNRRSFG